MELLRAVIAFACVVGSLFGMGCGGDGSGSSTPTAGRPPEVTVAPQDSALHVARLDVAKRADVPPLAVELTTVRTFGFDGCNGVIPPPGTACTALLGGGMVAIFHAGGNDYRYHVASRLVGPVPPALVAPESPAPAEIAPDVLGALSNYAREEFALRANVGVSTLAVTGVAPLTFATDCLAYIAAPPVMCKQGSFPGAVVEISNAAGTKAYFGVTPTRGVVFYDPAHGSGPTSIPANISGIELAMRQDLARRLSLPLTSISVVSYRDVVWPDSCLGVQTPGRVCSQATVPGFLAYLRAADGNTYRYHGTGDAFVAATFETGSRITNPIP